MEQNRNNAQTNANPGKTQFKATKIWNEILQAFYLGIKLGKHRRNMKTYHDCFVATEAVNWLKNYLRQCEHFQNNGNKVTRFQALNLLRKYHKSNIIERVKNNKNHKELQDNTELFRFTVDANENLPFLAVSKSEVDLLETREDKLSIELNLNEKISAHKQTTCQHIINLMPNFTKFIKLEKINGSDIFNNITRLNANGVVQLADKSQDLPHWIMSAMKCLANWPKASGSGNCLPKYPGFEFDVFKLIRDYFINLEEPLIPFEFYSLLMETFDQHVRGSLMSNRKLPTNSLYNFSIKHPANDINLPSNCVYETVFSDKDPVTKIVPIDELSGMFPTILDLFRPNSIPTSTNSRTFVNSGNVSSSSILTNGTFQAISTMPRSSSSKLRTQRINSSTPQNSINTQTQMFSDILHLDTPPETNKNANFRKSYSLSRSQIRNAQRSNETTQSIQMNSQAISTNNYQLLKLLLLLVPSSNRRHLQLLIRLFYKIIQNKELCLLTKDSITLKEQIVNIFTRCIIRCQKEADYNELKSKEFVSFLIDQCMDLFAIPELLTNEIEQTMKKLKEKKQTENGGVKNTNTNFCEKISLNEFELQRDVLSEMALSDLLESIMRDDTLTERDKLKWIKQFKMYHPDVYDIYFTNCNAKMSIQYSPEGSGSQNENRRTRSLGAALLSNRKLVKRFLSLKF